MTTELKNLNVSASPADFYATIEWMEKKQVNKQGEFHLPSNGDLYPHLHIETEVSDSLRLAIIEAFDILSDHKTAYAAMKEWNEEGNGLGLFEMGHGSNHIWFKEYPETERIAIIYFDPYEI